MKHYKHDRRLGFNSPDKATNFRPTLSASTGKELDISCTRIHLEDNFYYAVNPLEPEVKESVIAELKALAKTLSKEVSAKETVKEVK